MIEKIIIKKIILAGKTTAEATDLQCSEIRNQHNWRPNIMLPNTRFYCQTCGAKLIIRQTKVAHFIYRNRNNPSTKCLTKEELLTRDLIQ